MLYFVVAALYHLVFRTQVLHSVESRGTHAHKQRRLAARAKAIAETRARARAKARERATKTHRLAYIRIHKETSRSTSECMQLNQNVIIQSTQHTKNLTLCVVLDSFFALSLFFCTNLNISQNKSVLFFSRAHTHEMKANAFIPYTRNEHQSNFSFALFLQKSCTNHSAYTHLSWLAVALSLSLPVAEMSFIMHLIANYYNCGIFCLKFFSHSALPHIKNG